MNVKNIIFGGSSGGNTGIGLRFPTFGFVKGLIFTPPFAQLDASSIAAFKTAMAAAILADNVSDRYFPLQNIVKPTDSSTKPVEDKFPDGSIAIVNNGFYDWEFQFTKGGHSLMQALQKANGQDRWFFLFDAFGKLWGVDPGGDNIQAINPNLAYTPPFVVNTGSAVSVYATRVNFSTEQLNVNGTFLDFANDGGLTYLQGLSGLQDVVVTQAAARALGVLKVGAIMDNGTINLHDDFASDLAVTGAWRVRNKATKNPLTVTAAADDAGNTGWDVTVSVSDPNYNAGAGTLEVALVGPAELSPLLGGGYESNWLAQ